MRAITQTILATSRDFALQQHKHAHNMKMAKVNAASPWTQPAVVIPVVIAAVAYCPTVYRLLSEKVAEYRMNRYLKTRQRDLA